MFYIFVDSVLIQLGFSSEPSVLVIIDYLLPILLFFICFLVVVCCYIIITYLLQRPKIQGETSPSKTMYDETHYFDSHDPHSIPGGGGSSVPICPSQTVQNSSSGLPVLEENNTKLSTTATTNSFSIDIDLSNHHNHNQQSEESAVAAATMDFELEQEFNTHLMQEVLVHHHDPNSAAPSLADWEVHQHHQEMQEMNSDQQAKFYHQQQQMELQNNLQCFNTNPFTNPSYMSAPTSTPDLLNLLHLPRCSASSSMLPNSSISFSNRPVNFQTSSLEIFGNNNEGENASASSILYDHHHHPPLHLNNLPPQPPIFRELFQTLPHTYGLNGGVGSSLFGGGLDEGGAGGGVIYHHQDGDGMRQFENSVLDFRRDLNVNGGSSGSLRVRGGHGTKHFTTEKQRREQFNEKYKALSQLVPNPSKPDRASVVGDAIDYIKELRRTVDELKILVDKKRCGRERSKKLKTEDEANGAVGDLENSSVKPTLTTMTDRENSFSGPERSSWIQRKSKETEVDVRIIDDDVTIKLVQRSKMNNLLLVSKILDELQLDLLHVSGGCIGDYYSFLFNTKIFEGSSVYASAIAKKLLEGVDKKAIKPDSY